MPLVVRENELWALERTLTKCTIACGIEDLWVRMKKAALLSELLQLALD